MRIQCDEGMCHDIFLTVNLYLGPGSRVRQISLYQLTIGPEHHPDLDPEDPFKDREVIWARELQPTVRMAPSLALVQPWEVLSTRLGTINNCSHKAFICWRKKSFKAKPNLILKDLFRVKLKSWIIHAVIHFFFIKWRKKLKIERSNTRIDKHAQTLLREKEFRRPNCGQRFYYRDCSVRWKELPFYSKQILIIH